MQNYKHMNLHAFSKIACIFCGQYERDTHVSHLSCSCCVLYACKLEVKKKRNKSVMVLTLLQATVRTL